MWAKFRATMAGAYLLAERQRTKSTKPIKQNLYRLRENIYANANTIAII